MSEKQNALEQTLLTEAQPASQGIPVNFKRILDRAIRYWYLIALSLLAAFSIAFIINRYATRMYTVSASIIVREGNENAGAEFLYKNNPLVNPYRNYYNELYIMRSYPLLQQVVEQLNFNVVWYREGNVKTTEVYELDFPVALYVAKGSQNPMGKKMVFELTTEDKFTLAYYNADQSKGKIFENLSFNDTLTINGYRFLAQLKHPVDGGMIGREYVVEFRDSYQLAKSYSGRLYANWAEPGSSVINLSINGALPEKEVAFIAKFIERYQQYDVDKKNLVATKSIEFLDRQLANIGDSLAFFDNKIEDFKQDQLFTDFEAESGRILGRLNKLESQRTQFTLQDNYFRYLEEYLSKGKNFDQIVPPSTLGISDGVLTGLINQLTELQFGLRMMGDQQTETNPMVMERKQKIQQIKNDILEGIKSMKASQNINRDFLEKQIKESEKALAKLPQAERELVNIKRNYSIRENLYLFLMQKRAEAGISRASTTTDIIVVNPPGQQGGPLHRSLFKITPLPWRVGCLFLSFSFLLLRC